MDEFLFKKSLGQNFIKDINIINKIVNYANIDKDTLVIEIGPGAGALSQKIIPLSGFSILYEIDYRLKDILESKLNSFNNYKIIFNDFLLQNVSDDIKCYNYSKLYVVANLPYYITTSIVKKLMNEVYPDKIIIMVQDEVANRLCAIKGSRDYGMISVLISSKYNTKKLFRVSRNNFVPVPNVDSAVICLEKTCKYNINDFFKFEKLIKDAFQFKRKNLRNNLFNYDLNVIDGILKKYNLDLSCRAEEVDVSIFIEISNNI